MVSGKDHELNGLSRETKILDSSIPLLCKEGRQIKSQNKKEKVMTGLKMLKELQIALRSILL